MNSSVTSDPDQVPGTFGQFSESIVPVSSRELFWRAKYLRDAPSLAHLPFLFWLITDLRPRRMVTLNIGHGVAHFAACQALDRIGTDTTCLGFGIWTDTGVPEHMLSYNAEQYDEFSKLAELSPAKAVRRVRKASVDLLIVEGPLSSDVMEAVLKDWPPRLTDRGVILLTGLDSLSDEDADRLEDWCEGKRTVRFDHDGGVMLIGTGDETAQQSLRLSQLDPNSAAFMTIERIFARLGASHVNEWMARDKGQWARKLSENLRESEKVSDSLKSERDAYAGKLKTLEDAYETRQKRAAQTEADLYDARSELTALQTQAKAGDDALQSRIAEAEQARDAAVKEAEAARNALEELSAGRDTASAQASDDIRVMAADLQARDETIRDLQDRLRAAETACDSLQAEGAEQRLAQEAELVALTEMLEHESGQRIALSEEMHALERRAEADAAHHLEEIKALTGALAHAEERSIARNEALKTAQAEYDVLTQRLAENEETLKERTGEARALGEEAATLAQTIAQLEANAERRKDEARQEQKRVDGLQSALAQTRMARDNEEARNIALSNELAQLQETSQTTQEALTRKLDTAQATLQEYHKTIYTLRAKVEALEEHRSNLEQSRQDLMGSTSWRVTQPLRQVTTVMRKLK